MARPSSEETDAPPETASGGHRLALLCGLAAVGVFLLRILGWVGSEFWFDEVVTICDFAIGPPNWSLADVFRWYPIANNHILYTALLWVWLRLPGVTLGEISVRLPSILLSAGTILLAVRLWRQDLGLRGACAAGFVFAASPVYTAFAWQARGYGLSMTLAVLAVAGAADISRGSTRSGLRLAVPSCLLLPLVIPTNILLPASLCLFLLADGGFRKDSACLKAAARVGAAGLAGLSYYLTLWAQFRAALAQTAGWDSGFAVLGNVGLALVAHLGLIAVLFPLAACARTHTLISKNHMPSETKRGLLLAACCFLCAAGFALAFRRAPFPRVFLTLFAPLTFAGLQVVKAHSLWSRVPPLILGAAILLNGVVWVSVCEAQTRRAVAAGENPQDLLRQYYRGSNDLRYLAKPGGTAPQIEDDAVVLVSAHDFPTYRLYRARAGAAGERVLAENLEPRRRLAETPGLADAPLYVVAPNEARAAELGRAAGLAGSVERVVEGDLRSLYRFRPEGR